MEFLRSSQICKIETKIARKKHQLVSVNPDNGLLLQYLQLLAILDDFLSEQIIYTAVGVLVGDRLRSVLLPTELSVGLIVDECTAIEHWRQHRFAVSIVVKMIQFRVEENGETMHFEQSLRNNSGLVK